MIEVKKKEGESVNAFLFRFTKKIQQSGVLKEAKKRRFAKRAENKHARKMSALYRAGKKKTIEKDRPSLRRTGRAF
jgi:ribosomal protein S21